MLQGRQLDQRRSHQWARQEVHQQQGAYPSQGYLALSATQELRGLLASVDGWVGRMLTTFWLNLMALGCTPPGRASQRREAPSHRAFIGVKEGARRIRIKTGEHCPVRTPHPKYHLHKPHTKRRGASQKPGAWALALADQSPRPRSISTKFLFGWHHRLRRCSENSLRNPSGNPV